MRTRRAVLKDAVVGISAVMLSPALAHAVDKKRARLASTEVNSVQLTVGEALHEMADETRVYSWAYRAGDLPLTIPGPVLMAQADQLIEIALTNTLDEPHGFAIPGVVDSGPVPPGETRTFRFAAPAPGTWLYFDPLNAPVNRVLGLHGALVVHPPPVTAGRQTPYASPTLAIQRLFNDLGTQPEFPGDPWLPERSFIWLFSQIDPRFNAQAEAGATVNAAELRQNFLPRYFTLNGRSGVFSSKAPDTAPHFPEGSPTLLRSLNAGLATHSPHIHGNHVYQLAVDGVLQENVLLLDTWALPPLSRIDMLLPYRMPPDAAVWPPEEEPFPQEFVTHCHVEMSQTAAGGNYPWGAVTHFGFSRPL